MNNKDILDYMITRLRTQAATGDVDVQAIFEEIARVYFPPTQFSTAVQASRGRVLRDVVRLSRGDGQVSHDGLLEKLIIYEQFHAEIMETLNPENALDNEDVVYFLKCDVTVLRDKLAAWVRKWTIN